MMEHHLRESAGAARVRLSRGFLVVRNALISIGAAGLIAVMGLIAVPLLIDRLGAAKFGVISLAWIVIGYTSLLDLGLGRALTKLTADRLGAGRQQDIPRLFWMAIALLAAIGVVSGSIVIALSGWLANDVLSISDSLTRETQATFILLGCTVPFVLVSTALAGSLEAHQRFDLAKGVAVPLSFLSFFGPVAIAFFTTNLAAVVSAVCVSRISATAIYLFLCIRVEPQLRDERTIDRTRISPLLRYGGWVTVAAAAAGAMLSLDRLLIGATVSAAAVAFYATPYEASRQLLFVSGTFASVLFPGFAANVGRDRERTETLFGRGVRATFVGLFPLTLIASVLSYEILDVWINSEFARNGGPVLQLLPIGILINGLAFVAFALVQSTRPDIIAKIVCVELPLYLGGMWLFLHIDGIRGAAIAFTIRAFADTTILYWFTGRLGLVRTPVLLSAARMAALGLVAFGVGALMPSTMLRIVYLAAALIAFVPIAWRHLLTAKERMRLREKLSEMRDSTKLRVKRSAPDAA